MIKTNVKRQTVRTHEIFFLQLNFDLTVFKNEKRKMRKTVSTAHMHYMYIVCTKQGRGYGILNNKAVFSIFVTD